MSGGTHEIDVTPEIQCLLDEDTKVRHAADCLATPGKVRFACPNCGEEVCSDYFLEGDDLIGIVECSPCGIALVIR